MRRYQAVHTIRGPTWQRNGRSRSSRAATGRTMPKPGVFACSRGIHSWSYVGSRVRIPLPPPASHVAAVLSATPRARRGPNSSGVSDRDRRDSGGLSIDRLAFGCCRLVVARRPGSPRGAPGSIISMHHHSFDERIFSLFSFCQFIGMLAAQSVYSSKNVSNPPQIRRLPSNGKADMMLVFGDLPSPLHLLRHAARATRRRFTGRRRFRRPSPAPPAGRR